MEIRPYTEKALPVIKKIVAILLSLALALSLCACTKNNTGKKDEGQNSTSSAIEEKDPEGNDNKENNGENQEHNGNGGSQEDNTDNNSNHVNNDTNPTDDYWDSFAIIDKNYGELPLVIVSRTMENQSYAESFDDLMSVYRTNINSNMLTLNRIVYVDMGIVALNGTSERLYAYFTESNGNHKVYYAVEYYVVAEDSTGEDNLSEKESERFLITVLSAEDVEQYDHDYYQLVHSVVEDFKNSGSALISHTAAKHNYLFDLSVFTEDVVDIPVGETQIAMYAYASDAYCSVMMGGFKTSYGEGITINGVGGYYLVEEENIKSLDDMRKYLNQYFTLDYSNSLVDSVSSGKCPYYVDYDGGLYWLGSGRGSDIFVLACDVVKFVEFDKDHAGMVLEVTYGDWETDTVDYYDDHLLHLEKENDTWKFTDFYNPY